MKRSLFWLLDVYPETGESVIDVHATALDHVVEADRLGYTALWLAEHHFSNLGTAANPAVLLAAMAQATDRIRLGPATSVLPTRNPIHVAEDYALVDALSGGRLNMGVGSGSRASEFAPFGVDFDGRRELYDEHLAIIRARWAAASTGEISEHSLNVAPVQSPAPPIYVATMNADTAYRVGFAGDSLLTLVPPTATDLVDVAARVAAHARGLRESESATNDAESVVMIFAYVGDTDADCRATVVPALSRLMCEMTGTSLTDSEALYAQMRGSGAGLFGTPDDVDQQLQRYAEHGINHVAFVSRFGGMSREASALNLQHLAAGRFLCPNE